MPGKKSSTEYNLPAWLEWELLSKPITIHSLDEPGAFPAWVSEVQVERDERYKIQVTGTGTESIPTSLIPRGLRVGELLPDPPPMRASLGERRYVLERVHLNNSSCQFKRPGTVSGSSEVFSVQISNDKISRHVEWIANFDIPSSSFPRSTSRERDSTYTRSRFPDDKGCIIPSHAFHGSYDFFRLLLDINDSNLEILVGRVPGGVASDDFRPGFIEILCHDNEAPPSQDFIRTLLSALSFFLGRHIVSVGHTCFSSQWEIINAEAKSLRILGESFTFNNPCHPPCVLSSEGVFTEDRLSSAISAFMASSRKYKIEFPLYLYHVGRSSPPDVSAVHYGAALESLRRSYFEKENQVTTHLDRIAWKKICQELQSSFDTSISNLPVESAISLHIRNDKIPGLNTMSSNRQYPTLFSRIGINVAEVEHASLDQRNVAAHGESTMNPDYRVLINMNNALETLFHRVMMRVIGLDFDYIDYSTYGFPSRDFKTAQGGPEGDGKPIS